MCPVEQKYGHLSRLHLLILFPGTPCPVFTVDVGVSRSSRARVSTSAACLPNTGRQMTVTGGVLVPVH